LPREKHDTEKLERIAAAFRAGEKIYAHQGSPLYAALARAGANDPEILELAGNALTGAKPVHLFTAVHYLLLGGTSDPLARWFATLAPEPAPPDEAWDDFRRFCRLHRDTLKELLRTRPVQMTYVERCRTLLPALCHVADQAGEPLNLVEIGCSAGVLLTFDKYAYAMRDGERIGPDAAPFVLQGQISGGPRLRIPRIGCRMGIDLNLIDTRSQEDRRWMLATCFPELRNEQARLATAMDIVAETDIRWLKGDGLACLDEALERSPDPVCVYHSACLFYWRPEAKAALDAQLRAASASRTIYRVGIEPSDRYDQWQTGLSGAALHGDDRPSGEIKVTRYRNKNAEEMLVALSDAKFGRVWWLE
jgi:hypothetical protein